MTRLFDAQAVGERGWIWDVQTVDDNPAIVFASFTDGDEREQRYYYSKYTGSEWTVAEIVETDHLYATYRNGRANEREYAPGICLGHEQGDDVVYLSRNTGPRDDRKSGLQIEKWRVGDTHETSQPERVIERGDENNQFRPVAPRSVRNQTFCSPVRVVWMCCQSKAPYNYSDEEETVKLKAEIGTTEGTETVRMDNWKDYHDRR